MTILQQVVPVSCTSCTLLPPLFPAVSPFPLLPPSCGFMAQKQRRALPAPKIVGYLPAPQACVVDTSRTPIRRVVVAEIVNPLVLIDIHSDFDAWWAEFERVHGRVRTTEEMDAELEASHPGYMARFGRKSKNQSASDAMQVEVA